SALGFVPSGEAVYKFDWGVLRTDDGNAVLGRHYWSNQATRILSDVAAEAELAPGLWGHLRFDAASGPSLLPGLPGMPGSGGKEDTKVDDLLNELEEEER